jgi:hypothetical protein
MDTTNCPKNWELEDWQEMTDEQQNLVLLEENADWQAIIADFTVYNLSITKFAEEETAMWDFAAGFWAKFNNGDGANDGFIQIEISKHETWNGQPQIWSIDLRDFQINQTN